MTRTDQAFKLYVSRQGEAGAPLQPRIESELANHLGYVDRALAGREWLVGNTFSGADVRMSFVGEAARGLRASHPNMDAWVRRFQARPACARSSAAGRIRWQARRTLPASHRVCRYRA